MLIRRILLQNLHSLRTQVEIDFSTSPLADSGLFAITGDTGAGKSTILDALTLALYGKICRNNNESEALSYGAQEGMASCEFESKCGRFLAEWHIRRTRSRKENKHHIERSVAKWEENSSQFIIVAARKVREVNQLVEEVTGLDFERFTRSVMLAQGDFAAFLKARDTDRSDLLERITGTEVYSRLSMASLQRLRDEERKLQDVKIQLNTLKVFSKEEIAEVKAQLNHQLDEVLRLKKDSDMVKKALQWLEQVNSLRHRQHEAAHDLGQIVNQKTLLLQDLARLELHRKTLPFHPKLTLYDGHLTEASHLEAELQMLQADYSRLEQVKAICATRCEDLQKMLESLKEGRMEKMKLFDEISSLDASIQSTETFLKKEQSEWNALNEELHATQIQLDEKEHRKTHLQTELDNVTGWLKANHHLEGLTKDLPAIRLHGQQLIELLQKSTQTQKTRLHLLEEERAAALQLDEILQNIVDAKSEWSNLQQQFGQLAPDGYVLSRIDLLENLTADIETLSNRQKDYERLASLNAEYELTLAELANLEEGLDNLRLEQLALDKAILTKMDEEELLKQRLSFKREIYHQQLLIANYQKDRANLKPGEPCPLCLSTEHPFRKNPPKPLTDMAKQELELVELEVQSFDATQKALFRRHTEIGFSISQLTEGMSSPLSRLRSKLESCESEIAELIHLLPEAALSDFHGKWLREKIKQFGDSLASKKTARETLSSLHRRLETQEKAIADLESKYATQNYTLQKSRDSLRHQETTLDDLNKNLAATSERLNLLLTPYGFRFSAEEANGIFTSLEKLEREFTEKKKAESELTKDLELTQQACLQLMENISLLQSKKSALENGLSQRAHALEELKSKRLQKFGTKDPISERESYLQSIESKELELASARSEFEQTQEIYTRQKQALESLSKNLSKSRQSVEDLDRWFAENLPPAGFTSLDAMRSAVLPEEEFKAIETLSIELDKNETAARLRLKTAKEALNEALAAALTDAPPEHLQQQFDALETQLQHVQQEIGVLNQKLADNEVRQKEVKELQRQWEHQQKETNRWQALYELIGSSDGKKFRNFAQGLTLANLVTLANRHLQNLSGRYIIEKKAGEDLELHIVDTYQADHTRSMNTLSGGESFLVSLSLALGLSDLAGRDVNIRSLFIDEGFGTLDDQALDLAISTLENLQSKGKIIGIISHVKELKERIGTQIRVFKKGGGISGVEVIG